MAARFHTNNVVMAGVDVHDLDGVPTPCAVARPFNVPPTPEKTTPTVTAGYGHPLVQWTFKASVVPHVPFIPPQTPKGWADLAYANAEGSTMCVFAVASVTSGGEALACAIDGDWGVNANCWSVGAVSAKNLSGVTASYYDVLTNPTDKDIAIGLLLAFAESVYSTATKHAIKQLTGDEIIEKFIKHVPLPEARKRLERLIRERKTLEVVDTELK